MTRYIDCSHIKTPEAARALLDALYAALANRPLTPAWHRQYARVNAAREHLTRRGLVREEEDDVYA